jgi:hypothetical protein
MAHVDHVLAVVAVSDIAAGRAWYTSLFGREPDNTPIGGGAGTEQGFVCGRHNLGAGRSTPVRWGSLGRCYPAAGQWRSPGSSPSA